MLFECDRAIQKDLCDIAPPALSWALFNQYKVAYTQVVVNDYGTSIDVQEEGQPLLLKINDSIERLMKIGATLLMFPTCATSFIVR